MLTPIITFIDLCKHVKITQGFDLLQSLKLFTGIVGYVHVLLSINWLLLSFFWRSRRGKKSVDITTYYPSTLLLNIIIIKIIFLNSIQFHWCTTEHTYSVSAEYMCKRYGTCKYRIHQSHVNKCPRKTNSSRTYM